MKSRMHETKNSTIFNQNIKARHSEHSEESSIIKLVAWILRYAQNDKINVFSNTCQLAGFSIAYQFYD